VNHRFFLALTLTSSLAALAACGDDPTDPDGLLDSAEAEVVMRSAAALPLLPEFLEKADAEGEPGHATLLRARELWDSGTSPWDPGSAGRRRLAVGYALPVLLEAVPPEEWTSSRVRVDAWMTTAGSMLRHLSLPAVEARLDAAGRQLDRADQAGSDRERVRFLLLASSELVETTPRYVARSLAADADAAVRSAAQRPANVLSPAALERAERLRDWAVRAVEEGDYLRAIHRAHYAIQLVEER